jgi:hypothetical protein
MKNYDNIENNKNCDGSRTGYDGTGRSWRIYGASGDWYARANVIVQGLLNAIYGCQTLQEVSDDLRRVK